MPVAQHVPTRQHLRAREVWVSSEIATSIPREEAQQAAVARRPWRTLAVQLLGPLTIVGAIVWAVAQPYRIVLLDREGQGLYDYLLQPQLLALLVGLVFTLCIAPGLVEDLDAEELRGPAR
jgi:hypothetical protein